MHGQRRGIKLIDDGKNIKGDKRRRQDIRVEEEGKERGKEKVLEEMKVGKES